VQFNEDEFYDSSLPNQKIRIYKDSNLSQPITTLDDEETLKILDDIDIPIASQQTMQHDLGGGSPSTTANLDPAAPSQPSETSFSPHFQLTSDPDDHNEILGDQPPTPPLDPKADEFDQSDQSDPSDTEDTGQSSQMQPFVLINNTNFDPSGYEPLISTKRPRSDSDTSQDHSEAKRPYINLTAFMQAFLLDQSIQKQPKILISSIPPTPSGYNQLASHPFESQFRQAIQIEFNKLIDIRAFEPISAHLVTHAHQTNCKGINQSDCPRHQFIPIRWVFAYKSDESGYLTRFKARLCVRGDTQVPNDQDARTSTLAARTFRTLIAIITRFDLETFQIDTVNAFLNSSLKEEVYCRYPPGLGRKSMVLRLHKAVYSLRIAGKR
jgi:hypothetical protein